MDTGLVWVHRQGMRLSIKHPLVQIKFFFVRKQQVEVLKCLAEEEGLHHVLWPCVQRVPHITDCRVASTNFAIFLNPLYNKMFLILASFICQ